MNSGGYFSSRTAAFSAGIIVPSAIVGGLDDAVTDLNREAYEKIQYKKHLAIVKGAIHLFEEPGTLQEVARLAAAWFNRYLGN